MDAFGRFRRTSARRNGLALGPLLDQPANVHLRERPASVAAAAAVSKERAIVD
jgi:hypothetical protein